MGEAAARADGTTNELAHATSAGADVDVDVGALTGRAAVHELLATEGASTYLGDILTQRDSVLTRWPVDDQRPVTVWIQPISREGHALPHAAQVQRAFVEWEATGVPVRFVFVPEARQADVQVRWIDHFSEPISGKTMWAHDDDGWIREGRITLALQHSDGEPLDSAAVRALALHEVGHVLGLDHTSDSGNVMAPRVRVRTLSAADMATAHLLYQLPPGDVR